MTAADAPPRIVCLQCMRDVEIVWIDDYQLATRDWLARVRCHVDVWIRPHMSERPLLLEDLGAVAFEQWQLEAMERDAVKTMERVAQIKAWMSAQPAPERA